MYDLDNFAFPLNWFFYRTTEAGELLINYVHTVLKLRIKNGSLSKKKSIIFWNKKMVWDSKSSRKQLYFCHFF